MAKLRSQTSVHEKERMRAEIDSQVAEFLQRGGKIDVLTDEHKHATSNVGSVWHQPDDMSNLVAQ
jgi:hypothetical protein